MSLLREMSIEIVRAAPIYEQVSSSAQCFPGDIQGILTMNPRMISGDRCLFTMIDWARCFEWDDNLFEIAAAVGMNSAEAAMIEVKRKEDCFRTNSGVCNFASRPHRVCERLS